MLLSNLQPGLNNCLQVRRHPGPPPRRRAREVSQDWLTTLWSGGRQGCIKSWLTFELLPQTVNHSAAGRGNFGDLCDGRGAGCKSQIGDGSASRQHMYTPGKNSAPQANSRLGVVLNAPALNLLSAVRTAAHRGRSHLQRHVSHRISRGNWVNLRIQGQVYRISTGRHRCGQKRWRFVGIPFNRGVLPPVISGELSMIIRL